MTALLAARSAPEVRWKYKIFTLKSGTKAWQGGSACLEVSTGKVVPAVLGTGLVFLGSFTENVDATLGDMPVNIDLIEELVMRWYANATSTDAVGALDVGKECFLFDDQTVTITRAGRALAGRVWAVDATKGVLVQKTAGAGSLSSIPVSGAFVANDLVLTDVVNGGLYDVPTTAAASTITLPAGAADGTVARFAADGTKNGHTVTYRDATGPVALTTALIALKRHLVIVAKVGGKWVANGYTSP